MHRHTSTSHECHDSRRDLNIIYPRLRRLTAFENAHLICADTMSKKRTLDAFFRPASKKPRNEGIQVKDDEAVRPVDARKAFPL